MRLTTKLIASSLLISAPAMVFANTHHADEANAIAQAKISMAQAIQKAEDDTQAKAVEADFDHDNGKWIYEVSTLKLGTKYELKIDAQSGEIINRKEEKK